MDINYTLSVTLSSNTGSLIRVALIFERRGHFITGLEFKPSLHSHYSEMIISAKGPENKKEQIINQLEKLIDAVAVEDSVEEFAEFR